mgnify:CR=1 FL=1
MWLSNSSIGRKVVMSVTGIALCPVSDISHGDEPCCALLGRCLQHDL